MRKRYFYLLLLFILIILLPTLLSYILVDKDYHFTGFLVNPIDGHSYLAKMQQGNEGNWLFTSRFSSEPGEGVFLFTYYLFLGHISSVLNVPNILVFHAARIINSIFLFFMLVRLSEKYLEQKWPIWGSLFLVFGSGLGWLGLFFGTVLSDFKIPELYPFYSSSTNPHFPLSTGLMVAIIFILDNKDNKSLLLTILLSGFLLLIQPFCVLIITGLLVVKLVLQWNKGRIRNVTQLFGISFFAVIFGVYTLIITQNNPTIGSWNQQNITPSPPVWDILISLSPIGLFAIAGIVDIIRRKDDKFYPFIYWVVIVLLLAYLPLNLQRRFFIGLYIPVVMLGIKGIQFFLLKFQRKLTKIIPALFFTSIITNIILILMGILSVRLANIQIVMKNGDWEAIQWISKNIPGNRLFLTESGFGLYIPAYTGHRVVYGHPFETANAEKNLYDINQFYNNWNDFLQDRYLQDHGIDYVIVQDDIIPYNQINKTIYDLVYQKESFSIYAVKK